MLKLLLGLFLLTVPVAAEPFRLCNRSIVPVFTAIRYQALDGQYRKVGWFEIAPGECRDYNLGRNYTYYAEGKNSLSQWAFGYQIRWTGKQESLVDSVTQDKFSGLADTSLGTNPYSVRFARPSDGTNLVDDLKLDHDSAAQLGRALKGAFDWAYDLKRGPLAWPYRFGATLYAKDGKLWVYKVYEGSPADQVGLQAGDRIWTVNGQFVTTVDQFIRLLNEVGYNTAPTNRIVHIQAERRGEFIQGHLVGVGALAYHEFLDHRRHHDWWGAATWLTANAAALGLGPEAKCSFEAGLNSLFERPFDQRSCVVRARNLLGVYRERYHEIEFGTEVLAAFISPGAHPLVKALWNRPRVLRSAAAGRLVRAAVTNVLEGTMIEFDKTGHTMTYEQVAATVAASGLGNTLSSFGRKLTPLTRKASL